MPAMAVPLAAENLDTWEAWITELNGPRKAAFDDMNARHGLTEHRAYLQPTPDGNFLVLAVHEGPGAEGFLANAAASDDEFDQSDSVVVSSEVRASSSMRKVNASMREVSGSFALADPIAFFCECAIPSCYSVVWMSASSFDAAVEGRTDWLLVVRQATFAVFVGVAALRASCFRVRCRSLGLSRWALRQSM